MKDLSRIERAYLRSDQRRYHVPCPVCGTMAAILWQNIEWPQGQPEFVERCRDGLAADLFVVAREGKSDVTHLVAIG